MSSNENPLNWNSEDLDSDTVEKLKGDSIGNTTYSERFVLKTLLALVDLTWDEEIEEDLCFLWDMSIEEDVCQFLMKMSFPSIATGCLNCYDEKRFIEIVIGILGNIVSKFNIEDKDMIEAVLGWFQTEDYLILIQVIRFIKGISYFKSDELDFITTEIINKFEFILSNSTQKDLLLITLDVLAKLTTDFKIKNNMLNREIINSALVGYQEISKEENCDEFELVTTYSHNQQSTSHFVQFILNICLYVNEYNNEELLREFIDNKTTYSKLFYEILSSNLNLIDPFNHFEPIDHTTKFQIEAFAIIFPIVKIEYDKNILNLLINVISELITNSLKFIESLVDLFMYFMLNVKVNDVQENLTKLYCIIDDFEKDDKYVNKSIQLKSLLKP